MQSRNAIGLVAILGLIAGTLSSTTAVPKDNPAMKPIKDVPGLPRVLLIGDSISLGYTMQVRQMLQGKANVHRPPANCGPTTLGVEKIDHWLGKEHWDVIHFNWGLHDLIRLMPAVISRFPSRSTRRTSTCWSSE